MTTEDLNKRLFIDIIIAFSISNKNVTTYDHYFHIIVTAAIRLGNKQLVMTRVELSTGNNLGI